MVGFFSNIFGSKELEIPHKVEVEFDGSKWTLSDINKKEHPYKVFSNIEDALSFCYHMSIEYVVKLNKDVNFLGMDWYFGKGEVVYASRISNPHQYGSLIKNSNLSENDLTVGSYIVLYKNDEISIESPFNFKKDFCKIYEFSEVA